TRGRSATRGISPGAPPSPPVVPAQMPPRHALQKHRQENHVHTNERRPEMHFAPELAHLSTSRFREPVIDASEESEDRARRNDVMKVRDHVISVVQIKVGRVKCQRDPSKTANSEHRQKGNSEKHWHVEAYGAAPK